LAAFSFPVRPEILSSRSFLSKEVQRSISTVSTFCSWLIFGRPPGNGRHVNSAGSPEAISEDTLDRPRQRQGKELPDDPNGRSRGVRFRILEQLDRVGEAWRG